MSRQEDTEKTESAAREEIVIGISACLLGQMVRFDGGHKRDDFILNTVSRFVRFVPVCPEVDIGLGTPREAIRLVRSDAEPRLVGTKTGTDLTARMQRYARRRVRELAAVDLSGYILKKDSPSCGLHRVRVYDANNVPSKNGRGLFAVGLVERLPLLPVEEEGRLRDPRLRENFFERVFAYRRLRQLFGRRWSIGDLVRFHTAEKLLLLAHDPGIYRQLGKLVAEAKLRTRKELAEEYQSLFMASLAKLATKGRHMNVLQHITGHFKKLLDREDRAEITGVVRDFRAGVVPLVVPVTLIRHHVRRHQLEYLSGQTYLEPHPKELMLRNHV